MGCVSVDIVALLVVLPSTLASIACFIGAWRCHRVVQALERASKPF